VFKVFLDANVLYSNAVRSLFIWLHINRAVQLYWSQKVWEEAFLAFSRNNGDELAARFRASMMNNVLTLYSECIVRDYADKDHGLGDKDDNHVVSAALGTEVDFLLTFDLKLIADCRDRFSFSAKDPDTFLVRVVSKKSPAALKQSLVDHFRSLTTSKPSWAEYITGLERAGLKKFSPLAKKFRST
jgi:predicted nucleic acid-binding protein